MTTSLSSTDVPLAGPGEGEGNGNWKRTVRPIKRSATRSVYSIGKRKREGIGEGKQRTGLGNSIVELDQGTEAGNRLVGLDRETGIENGNGK